MLFSELLYETVRDSINLGQSSLEYADFCAVIADNEPMAKRWSLQLSGAVGALNLGISRLSASNKIPFFQKMVGTVYAYVNSSNPSVSATLDIDAFLTQMGPTNVPVSFVYVYPGWKKGSTMGSFVDMASYGFAITGTPSSGDTISVKLTFNKARFTEGRIVNVAELMTGGGYRTLDYRTVDGGKGFYITDSHVHPYVLVEYKKRIPHFGYKDIVKVELDSDLQVVDNNIDMESFGISDQMCDYLKEFAKAQITETIAPEISNNHNTRAEQYFADLPDVDTMFAQREIRNVQKGWVS